MLYSNPGLIIGIVFAVIFTLISLGGGIFCLIRYARTRKLVYLIVGLLLTLILPGLCICATLVFFIPSVTVVYGPPPTITP